VTGFEAVPGARDRPVEGHPPLDLTGVEPAEAIARIAALDARYEAVLEDGVNVVRPRKAVVDGTPLDLRVDEFRARGETAEQILRRVVQLLDGDPKQVSASLIPARPPASGKPDPTLQQREHDRQERARGRRLSFTLHDTTIRQILNTLSRMDAAVFWRVFMQPDIRRGLIMTLVVEGWPGWAVYGKFDAPPWEPATKR
jgi:hypothetical protein